MDEAERAGTAGTAGRRGGEHPSRQEPTGCAGVWRFTAEAVDASVPEARHAVRDLLAGQRVGIGPDTLHGLLLIVSELVTNAVRHAALLSPTLAVEVAVGPEWIRVSVEDDHPYRPTALEADHGRTGGRGLLLVREIAREAGGVCDVEQTAAGGKVIWAALPLAAPARQTPGALAAENARDARRAPGVVRVPVAGGPAARVAGGLIGRPAPPGDGFTSLPTDLSAP